MTRKTRKRIILIGVGTLVLVALAYGFWPEPVAVTLAPVERGPLQVIVEEEGETQVAHNYVISSPVAAFAQRIELEAGDRVERGEPVVQLEPPRPAILDPRTRDEAQARVEAAKAALAEAEEERQRIERLFEGGSATQQTLTQARSAAEQARANLGAARAAARAAPGPGTNGHAKLATAQVLRAPVSGRVLAVHHKSEGQVNPGAPLVELGDVDNLEVRVEVLSQDAVRIGPGTRVLLEQWGGDSTLQAVVDRVEPQGFTKVSSLGVEEKRVTVVADLTSPPQVWHGLGAGYRVLARFIVWEGEDVLQVPTSALFRTGDSWAIFVVEDGKAVQKAVEVGHQTGLAAQVVSGLQPGEQVIVHPDNDLEPGMSVKSREE